MASEQHKTHSKETYAKRDDEQSLV